MDLNALAQGFMTEKRKKLEKDLAEKYDIPPEEINEIVDSFMEDKYGPAERMACKICGITNPVFLFIGRKDCPICQRSWPYVERFLCNHKDIELIRLDYAQPVGLLYHMIHQQDKGMLPMIGMISQGLIWMIFTGECVNEAVYEKYYSDITQCKQPKYISRPVPQRTCEGECDINRA